MKINYGFLAIVFVVLYAVAGTFAYIKLSDKFDRVEGNQTTLLDQVNDLNKDKQLVLTPKEFKKSMDSATGVWLKQLDLHTKNVDNIVKAQSQMFAKFATENRDTSITRVINNNTVTLPAKVFSFNDKYLTAKGIVFDTQTEMTLTSWDELSLLLYWKREGKFLPAIFGKKVYRGAVKGENPYMEYIVNKNIKVQKE